MPHEVVLPSSVIALSIKSLQPGVGNGSAATSSELSNYPSWFLFTAVSGKNAIVNTVFSDYLSLESDTLEYPLS